MVFKSYASPFAWACFLGILLLLNYFSIVDIYHAHFFSTGLTVFFIIFVALLLLVICYGCFILLAIVF